MQFMHTCARARTHARTQVKKPRSRLYSALPDMPKVREWTSMRHQLSSSSSYSCSCGCMKAAESKRSDWDADDLTSPHLRPPLPCIQHDLMTSGNTIIQKHLIYVPVILTNPTTTQAMVRACVPPHRSVIVSLVGYFSCAGGPLTTCGMCRSCGFFLRSADVRHSQSFSDAAA
jgi:hypothetical protein